MKKIGITGQHGFIGSHLARNINLFPEEFELIAFENTFFSDQDLLLAFVRKCDVIIHLAAVNRGQNPEKIYSENMALVQQLVNALEKANSSAQILFSSSTQELQDNLYGKSKREGRQLLQQWAQYNQGKFCGLIIPNVFGPFGKPFYNSFIATFCQQLIDGQKPVINADNEVQLIYVQDLMEEILTAIRNETHGAELYIAPRMKIKVSDVLKKLENFHAQYCTKREIPQLQSDFDLQLFNTFRSFINYAHFFPIKYTQHTDNRGSFVEIIRLGIGGQCSFSTTVRGVTRGNHFHTRKIERFAVIKGRAQINLRKIGTSEVISFLLDGAEPAFVDMPVWYTHNLTNIGDEELYTIFWINEAFDPENPDTYFEEV